MVEAHHTKPTQNGDGKHKRLLKVSNEYDSEGGVFVHKVSTYLLDGLAKLKTSFTGGPRGGFSTPVVGLVSKHLSVLYDHDDRNALVTLAADLGRHIHLKYLRDIKERQGELKVRAHGFANSLKAELECDLPLTGRLPRASLTLPFGEVKVEEDLQEDEDSGEVFGSVSVSGFVGGPVLGGLVVADYGRGNANLKYTYKDREMTLTPILHWPAQSLSVVFKRQFDPSNKLTYSYHFDSFAWNGVFKHKPMENFKLKLGYDSDARLCWGSIWVGKEDSGAKKAPNKCKLQVMLQVPQDDLQSALVLFRIKKRWDI